MTIQLPTTAKHLVGQVNEEKLILIALLHLLHKEYGHNWCSLYHYDVTLIVSEAIRFNDRHTPFEDIRGVVNMRYCNNYKTDLMLKRWTTDEFDYKIQDFKHVIIWTHILDLGNLEETAYNIVPSSWRMRSRKEFENLSKLLKKHCLEYDRNQIRK
jgi:hypothetical protein